jgi:predicted naringenin-chalcone synthase
MDTKAAITSIGTANPIYKQEQSVTAGFIAQTLRLSPAKKRLLKSVYQSTAIDCRYSVLSDFCKEPGSYEFFPNDVDASFPSTGERMRIYKEHALPLAMDAIKDCFSGFCDFDRQSITHVITASCTGMYAPGIDIEIVKHLKLNTEVKRTVINFMGCYAAFNAIKVAHDICRSSPSAKVLVVCVELCTIHFQKNTSIDNIFANAIFADGAAAVLIESVLNAAHKSGQQYFKLEDFYCDILSDHHSDMTWHIADNGFDIVLSSYVPQAIQHGIADFTFRFMKKYNLSLEDIGFYAIHPGGYKILKACEEALSITEYDNRYAYHVLKNYGNMSSATVLFVLKAIWDDIQIHHKNINHKNSKIFSCAFGPGLTLESMILEVGRM